MPKNNRKLLLKLPPQLLEPRRVGGGVPDGVLNVPMPQIILNQSRIGSLVGKGKATGVAQHVGMGREGQGGGLAARIEKQINGRTVQRLALLTNKKRLAGRPHPGSLLEPCADGLELVAAQRLRGR
jgi:hypothetical protein